MTNFLQWFCLPVTKAKNEAIIYLRFLFCFYSHSHWSLEQSLSFPFSSSSTKLAIALALIWPFSLVFLNLMQQEIRESRKRKLNKKKVSPKLETWGMPTLRSQVGRLTTQQSSKKRPWKMKILIDTMCIN